jgi:hypothetical protein
MFRRSAAITLFCAVALAAIYQHFSDPPLNDGPLESSLAYDLEDVAAPRLTGSALVLLSKTLQIPVLGSAIISALYHDNKLSAVRVL